MTEGLLYNSLILTNGSVNVVDERIAVCGLAKGDRFAVDEVGKRIDE